MELFDTAESSMLDNDKMYDFIAREAKSDTLALRLLFKNRESDFDVDFAINQIECRRKCARKLPDFIECPRFLFPSDLAAQQATDSRVARRHAGLVPAGSRWLDLTAGLGIDALSAARAGHLVTAVEIESWKCDVLRHNAEVFPGIDSSQFTVICADACQIAADAEPDEYDVIFIDPARRGEGDRRLYSLADCMPNVEELMPQLLCVAPTVIVKASPMLDVAEAVRRLPNVAVAEALSVRGECKELLLSCRRNATEVQYRACLIDAYGNERLYSFASGNDRVEADSSGLPEVGNWQWVYEPDAAVLKLNVADAIMNRWPQLHRADLNTQLYLSGASDYIEDFPGRGSRVIGVVTAKDLKRMKGEKLTVVCRNYPEKPEVIRSRYKFGESDSRFLYCFRLAGKPVMLLTETHKQDL